MLYNENDVSGDGRTAAGVKIIMIETLTNDLLKAFLRVYYLLNLRCKWKFRV